MCVIAVKNKGVDIPNSLAINDMWDTNSDGAGFMYTLNNKVNISKGFMTVADLEKALNDLKKDLTEKSIDIKDIPMVFHFRIGTHGSKNAANTHPFPVSSKEKYLKALDVVCDLGLVHNGVISTVRATGDMSDTMQYIIDMVTPLAILNRKFYTTDAGQSILENTIGYSKLAFLDKDGLITTIGQFKNGTKNGTEGLLFSNLNHEYEYSYASGTCSDGSCTTPSSYGFYDTYENLIKLIPVGMKLSTGVKTTTVTESMRIYVDPEGFIYTSHDGGKTSYESKFYISVVDDNKRELTAEDIEGDYISTSVKVFKSSYHSDYAD